MPIDIKNEFSQPPAPEDGFVYMLYSVGLIKIGFTLDPIVRFEKMRAMSSAPLSLIWLTVGTRATEGELHKQFRNSRERGEWFRPSPELRDFLAEKPVMGGMAPIDRLKWAETNPTKAFGP